MSQRFSIEAENTQVEASIEQLYQLIKKEGGEIHPAITIRQAGNDISVFSSLGRGSRETVFKIPRHCLPDQRHFSMLAEKNEIVITNIANDCPPVERELQERMIELYNLTHKIETQYLGDPRIALRNDPELRSYLYKARPVKQALYAKESDNPANYHALKGFLLSRVLKHTGEKSDDDVARAYLMPFVDCLNHHPQGATYQLTSAENSQRWLSSANCKPDPLSRECFACYGQHYDPLDLYLTYNFVDMNSPTIGLRSIPMQLSFEGLGTVMVGAIAEAGITGELPQPIQDLRFWIPKMHRPAERQLEVSHLLLPHSDAPIALRRVLSIIIYYLCGKSGALDGELIQNAERQVIEKNALYFQQLSALAAERTVTKENLQVLNSLHSLVEKQLSFINAYQDRINTYN